MLKRLILGDIHGHYKNVLSIIEKENPDNMILLGDYCDSFTFRAQEIQKCWTELIKIKNAFETYHGKDSFIMCLGNHDWHYINSSQRYSGFSHATFRAMHDCLTEAFNNKILKIAFIDNKNKTIYSHAGFTNTWINDWLPKDADINDVADVNENALDFSSMSFDMNGNSKYQGPLWVRPEALHYDQWGKDNGWVQIVGHTRTRDGKPIILCNNDKTIYREYVDNASLYCIDCLPFFYMKEELDDTGLLIKRELCKFEEIDVNYMQ